MYRTAEKPMKTKIQVELTPEEVEAAVRDWLHGRDDNTNFPDEGIVVSIVAMGDVDGLPRRAIAKRPEIVISWEEDL